MAGGDLSSLGPVRLPLFSVRNPVFVNLLLLVCVATGAYFYLKMPREVFPEIPLDMVSISTHYEGLSPEQMEREITIPIEDVVHAISGVDEVNSRSLEGLSLIELKLEAGRDSVKVAQDVRSAIERITGFPAASDKPVVTEVETRFPVINVTVHGDGPESDLRMVAKRLESEIERVAGVSTVVMTGHRDREVSVELDPLRLDAFGAGAAQVADAVAARNLDVPAGVIRGSQSEFLVRTLGEYDDIRALSDVTVRQGPGTNQVRVGDVGSVRMAYEDEKSFGKINGQRAISLEVTKRRSGDTIAIVNEIRQAVEEVKKSAPSGVGITLTRDGSVWIKSRLKTLYSNGLLGFVLVCVILFLFMDWRMAFWTAVGIPTSFLIAFILMGMAGMSINMLSLFALIVVLGMLVDDAIIVTENVYRYLLKGYAPRVAAVVGSAEVMMPVIAATTTTMAAFLPMLLMTGIMGKFTRVIPIVVVLCLIGSMIESLIMLPSHLADFGRSAGQGVRREGHRFRKIRKRYVRLIVKAVRHRYLTMGLVILASVGALLLARYQIKFVLFNIKDIPGFAVLLETPEGSSLKETERLLGQIEQAGAKLPKNDLNAMVTLIGSQFDVTTGRSQRDSNLGMVYFELADFGNPDRRNGYDIMNDLRSRLSGLHGYKSMRVVETQGGPPVGRPVEVKVRGDNVVVLRQIAREIETFLGAMPGVGDINTDDTLGKQELVAHVDEERAAFYGLNAAAISRAVRIAVEGEKVSEVRRGDETLDLVVRYAGGRTSGPQILDQVRILSPAAEWVPLSSVASVTLAKGPSAVVRKDRKRTILVSAAVEKGVITSSEANRRVREAFGDVGVRYPGYELGFAGESEQQAESIRSLGYAALLGMLLIYMILGASFRSFVQPFIIMVTLPFAFIGVVVGHWVMMQPLGFLSLIGLAGLAGVVVNDSLLLVAFVNLSRRRGGNRFLSVARASRDRLRPILLTSVTTIAGLCTLSFQTRGQAAYLAPMAISIVWGLAFATVLTLVVVPCVMSIVDDVAARMGWRIGPRQETVPLEQELARLCRPNP